MELFTEHHENDIVVLTVSGQLDIDTAPALRETFDGLLGAPLPRIVVDLSGVTFCDSVGLGTFAYAHNHCTRNGGFLRLANPRPFLVRVLATVGLSDRIPIFDSVALAQTLRTARDRPG